MSLLQRDFVKVQNDFTIIPNEILRNHEMKSSTKNILLTMFSLPPTWDFSIAGIAKCVYEGKETVQKALVELEKIGYITRKRERKENGTLGAMIYTIHQFPVSEEKNTYKKNFRPNQDVKIQKQEIPKQDLETQLRTNNKLNTDDILKCFDNIDNNLNDIDTLRTDNNSLPNGKDNSKETLGKYNSQVGELGGDVLDENQSESLKSNITLTLGKKGHLVKEHQLRGMPIRAREIAYRLTGNKQLSDKAFDCVEYFVMKYKLRMGKEHINLTNPVLERVVYTMLSTITETVNGRDGDCFENDYTPLISHEVEADDYKEVIDQYFDTLFKKSVDYSIVHFTDENILPKIMNKCSLYGGNWHESHSID